MDMEAEPHPSFTCGTKGTSTHMAGVSAASGSPAPAAETSNKMEMMRNFMISANRDNDQNQRQDCQSYDDQVAVCQPSSGKILLRNFRTGRQPRQVITAQLLNSGVHLLIGGMH